MIIPTFVNPQAVDDNGYLTADFQMYNDELNNVLRNGLSDNGWTIPQITDANLTILMGYATIDLPPDGALWYVIDASPPTLVVKISGALKKISTTAYP